MDAGERALQLMKKIIHSAQYDSSDDYFLPHFVLFA